jgi:hypothetical protein
VYQVNENGGIDTWALLPQIYYFDGGTAQYNYNFSFDQFSILLDASFPLNQLPTSFTLYIQSIPMVMYYFKCVPKKQ